MKTMGSAPKRLQSLLIAAFFLILSSCAETTNSMIQTTKADDEAERNNSNLHSSHSLLRHSRELKAKKQSRGSSHSKSRGKKIKKTQHHSQARTRNRRDFLHENWHGHALHNINGSNDYVSDPADNFPLMESRALPSPPYEWPQCSNDKYCKNDMYDYSTKNCNENTCAVGEYCADSNTENPIICKGWISYCFNEETKECRRPEYTCSGSGSVACSDGETCVGPIHNWCGGNYYCLKKGSTVCHDMNCHIAEDCAGDDNSDERWKCVPLYECGIYL